MLDQVTVQQILDLVVVEQLMYQLCLLVMVEKELLLLDMFLQLVVVLQWPSGKMFLLEFMTFQLITVQVL